ncbi:hypothetical protein HID58_003722 [Brassica napus]|uniref:acid phosphatase n=1 Tax=Brassica napus TaxID=3708 RepID=A0ABQ8ER06_BRANA|nr:hypothetical protein HID58_003722 [Brassica napus]
MGTNVTPLDPTSIASIVQFGLKPSTVYYNYRCGDPSHGMSKIHHFKIMPNSPDLVLLVGDVSYANLYLTNGTSSDCYSCNFSNTPIHETYQPRWDYWGRFTENLTSTVPLMVVEGNHELELQAGNKTFEAYSSRFAFPYVESGSTWKFYYSFNAGGIHFVMLGAYIDFDRSGEQYEWLKRDLAKFNRSVTPWLVVTWHPPWYSTYTAHYKEAEYMKVAMEELLYSYGTDIIFNGHVRIGTQTC